VPQRPAGLVGESRSKAEHVKMCAEVACGEVEGDGARHRRPSDV